ncbi:hypothetical protein, partial [Caballeronia sp.]|uniref:hypothetical protein n=1 Tax=Caballeronia sp. TaxID=1931223 RepID=UPI003C694944
EQVTRLRHIHQVFAHPRVKTASPAMPLSDRLDSRKRRNLILRIICHRNIFFPVSKWEMSHTSDKIASDIYWVFHDASL